MQINPIKANMIEVKVGGGLVVLLSYCTPVACVWTNCQGARTILKTSKRWSNTTSRHINKWISIWVLSEPVIEQPQEYFDALMMGIK